MRLRYLFLYVLMAVFSAPIRAGSLMDNLTLSYIGNRITYDANSQVTSQTISL
jgi:hypothetical protein